MGALTAIGALSIDMFCQGYQIKNDFNTTTANAQLTLSLFMIGLGLGNLFVGPISDSIGRKETTSYIYDYICFSKFRNCLR